MHPSKIQINVQNIKNFEFTAYFRSRPQHFSVKLLYLFLSINNKYMKMYS